MILGLTGGIASGKSTASNCLRELGYEVVDADRIAHEILRFESCKKKLGSTFGEGIFMENGEIDRKILGKIALSSKENIKKLNSIVHPEIIMELERRKRIAPKDKIVIFDIPLLFEIKLEYLCDKILLIYTDRETQIKRAMARDNSDFEMVERVIKSQSSVEEKISKADYAIDNSKDIEYLKNEIDKILDRLKKEI